ncbi:MAG: MFS transporter [Verrucomicrobia bacterium]|nr:MFS transporter [Verrucomicrobiota bacterium]
MSSSPPRTRLLTWLCHGAMMSVAIGINLLPVFLTTLGALYGGAAGLTQEQLGRLGALVFGGIVTGILFTGPLADRLGAKPFAILGNLIIAASLLAMAFSPGYASLGLAAFCIGLGAGTLDMVLSPVVSALHPGRRAVALNWLHAFYSVGAVLTVLAGTLALRAGLGWRGSCLLLLPLPFGLAAVLALREFPPLSAAGGRTPLRTLFQDRWFGLALAGLFLVGATELGMAQWLAAYAEESLGFPKWIGGAALLLFSAAMALGRMLAGVGGTNPFKVMAWSCATSGLLFLLGAFFPVPVVALTCCIAVGFTASCLWPTLLAVTANRHPEGGASMFGALAACGNAGGIFMPWVVGWVADRHNLHWGLALASLAPILLLPLVRVLRFS